MLPYLFICFKFPTYLIRYGARKVVVDATRVKDENQISKNIWITNAGFQSSSSVFIVLNSLHKKAVFRNIVFVYIKRF